jgi:hypothetical protein
MLFMKSTDAVWRSPLWLGLLVACSAALTMSFTCITPFAAFAVVAATSLSRRNAIWLTIALWIANQAVGYGVLHYPWDGRSLAWGIAIGAAAIVGTLAARWAAGRLSLFTMPAQATVAFVVAFAAYQVALYIPAVTVLGGTGAFTPGILGQVLVVNLITLVGLYGLAQLAVVVMAAGERRRRTTHLPAKLA